MTQYTAKKVYMKDAEDNYVIPYINPADTTNLGAVKPDGTTITSNNGTISSVVNQSYNATSADAQSGKAVAEALDTIAISDDRLHAIKGYLESGKTYTDATLYNDVNTYAHSTFDSSKFTAVGTPTVSDGVLYPTTSAYLTNSITVNNNKFEFICKFNTGTLGTAVKILYDMTRIKLMLQYVSSSQKHFPLIAITDGNNSFAFRTNTYALQDNTDYITYFSYDHATLGLEIKLYDANLNLLDSKTSTSSNDIVIPNNTYTAMLGGNSNPVYALDLKCFSAWFDNIPVFSGNKTGIDTIKPDNYTVVGTPTISADGVASGLSTSNYLTAFDVSQLKTKSFVIKGIFTVPDNNFEIFNNNLSITHLGLAYTKASNYKEFRFRYKWQGGSGTGGYVNVRDGDQGVNTNVGDTYEWYYKLTYPNTLDFGIKKVGTSEWTTRTNTDDEASGITVVYNSDNTTILTFGKQTDDGLNGSIDLNSFHIYVDGDLVYQPCLKIPYNQSKTGSKIVDVAYRDRVIDTYNQFGSALYYTIDETNKNVTLPMGSIYGLITQQGKIDSYRNGITYWDLYSDGTLEIGGTCTSGTSYTLPRAFKDTNYVLTVPYSAKTTTTFTPSATGDFIAKGLGE